jgi:hypothetical protein
MASADSSGGSTEGGGADSSGSIDSRYLDYAKKLIAKYDTSGDGRLTKDEWSSMSKDPSAADTDGDGKIDDAEYARWMMNR